MITKSKPKLLLVGCGDIAQRLAAKLDSDHYHCVGLRRNTSGLASNIEALACDLNDSEAVQKAISPGFDYIVITLTPNQRDEAGYRQTFVSNLSAVLNAVKEADIPTKHIVFVSSTSVYAQDDGEWVDEQSVTEPTHYRGKIILEAEKLCLNSSIPTTIIRFSGIYGPGRGRLIKQVRDGNWSTEDKQWTNRIHSDDAARVLAWCLDRARTNKSLEKIYLASDSEPTPKKQVCEWMANKINMDGSSDENEADKNKMNKRCSNKKLLMAGFSFRYPNFRDGYRQLLAGEKPH